MGHLQKTKRAEKYEPSQGRIPETPNANWHPVDGVAPPFRGAAFLCISSCRLVATGAQHAKHKRYLSEGVLLLGGEGMHCMDYSY
jgi:hypothetical protein